MSQEVLEMMQKMGLHTVEMQMALQCAPLAAGLKVSNLLIISAEDVVKVKQILKYSDMEYEMISVKDGKATMLLYRREELEAYFSDKGVRLLLQFMGYQEFSLSALLCRFQQRYLAYQQNNEEFPHEMGLFLGYPLEDVIGFIKNQGKNFLYTGYWKVYADLKEKVCLFQKFEMAQEMIIQFISNGGSMEQVLQDGKNNLLWQIMSLRDGVAPKQGSNWHNQVKTGRYGFRQEEHCWECEA